MALKNIDELINNFYQITEVKNLEFISESNSFHTERNVLEHTRLVELNLNNELSFDYIDDLNVRNKLINYVYEKIGDYTRGELLRVATVLHDIGKGMSYILKDNEMKSVLELKVNGDTTSPQHAKVGSENVYDLLIKENLSKKDALYVKDIVSNHMRIFSLYDGLFDSKNKDKTLNKAINSLGDNYIDILIHTRADLKSSIRRDDFNQKNLEFKDKIYESDIDFVSDLIYDRGKNI
jgi:hypothetical protein